MHMMLLIPLNSIAEDVLTELHQDTGIDVGSFNSGVTMPTLEEVDDAAGDFLQTHKEHFADHFLFDSWPQATSMDHELNDHSGVFILKLVEL